MCVHLEVAQGEGVKEGGNGRPRTYGGVVRDQLQQFPVICTSK